MHNNIHLSVSFILSIQDCTYIYNFISILTALVSIAYLAYALRTAKNNSTGRNSTFGFFLIIKTSKKIALNLNYFETRR